MKATFNEVNYWAWRFFDATLNRWGTNEESVNTILQKVHDVGAERDFEFLVATFAIQDRDRLLTRWQETDIVSAILKDELTGSELAKAQDIYELGYNTYKASINDYLVEGLLTPLDFSTNAAKAYLVTGTVLSTAALGAIGMLFSAPVALAVGSALVIGGATLVAATAASNAIHLWRSHFDSSDAQEKIAARDIGESLTSLALIAIPAWKGFKFIQKEKANIGNSLSKSTLVSAYRNWRAAENTPLKLAAKVAQKFDANKHGWKLMAEDIAGVNQEAKFLPSPTHINGRTNMETLEEPGFLVGKVARLFLPITGDESLFAVMEGKVLGSLDKWETCLLQTLDEERVIRVPFASYAASRKASAKPILAFFKRGLEVVRSIG